LVINFKKENEFIDVKKATFFISNDLRSPMGSNAAAFTSDEEANTIKNKIEGQLMKWDEVYKKIQ
jgi:copper chaperone NosL